MLSGQNSPALLKRGRGGEAKKILADAPAPGMELWFCPWCWGSSSSAQKEYQPVENIGWVLTASRFFLTYRKLQVICKALEVSDQRKPQDIASGL